MTDAPSSGEALPARFARRADPLPQRDDSAGASYPDGDVVFPVQLPSGVVVPISFRALRDRLGAESVDAAVNRLAAGALEEAAAHLDDVYHS